MSRSREVLALAVLLLASGFLPAGTAGEVAPVYVSHAAININGDTQLRNAALAEGWPGTGTPADPYIIQDYDIAGGYPYGGIRIYGPSLSITIRNNRLHDLGSHGIIVQQARGDLRIESNLIDGAGSVGIYVIGSTATITGNTVTNPRWTGIDVLYGTYTVTGNTVSHIAGTYVSGHGLLVSSNTGSVVSGNTIEDVNGNGVTFGSSTGTTITGNTFDGVSEDGISIGNANGGGNVVSGNAVGPGAANGIHVYDSKSVDLQGNTVRGAAIGLFAERTKDSAFAGSDLRANEEGIRLDTVTNTMLRTNTLADNGMDLHLKVAEGNLIFDNRFESHASVWLQLSQDNRWSVDPTPGTNVLGGAFLGGNAWWDYTGVDANLDGLGEVPHGPVPYGALPRDTLVEDTYAEVMPYGPYDLHPLMSGPVATGVLARVGV